VQSEARIYSLPRWRLTRWLIDVGPDVPDDIRRGLVDNLFGGLPVFFGGAINTILVSGTIAAHTRNALFIGWFLFEIAICLARLVVLVVARRAALKGRETPTDIYFMLSLAWSCGVGYGIVISMANGDWLVSTVACLSGAAMVGGICLRNFGAPRLAAAMILTSIGPSIAGAALSGEPLLFVVFIQAPMYFIAVSTSAFKLNKMLIATMMSERENGHRATHDALTGLLNRHGLVSTAETALSDARDHGRPLALLFLDLDGFKAINDTYGHGTGDRLLRMVADRLRRWLRPTDIAARIGGDEFVLLIEGLDEAHTLALAQDLIGAVGTSYDFGGGQSASVGLSIGIAMAPRHGSSIEELLTVADAALYRAKSQGKSRCCMASVTANVAALQRVSGRAAAAGNTVAA
jgi:diguanylate cyclase (GGDEF)-like protein